jgi:hypothetical protein
LWYAGTALPQEVDVEPNMLHRLVDVMPKPDCWFILAHDVFDVNRQVIDFEAQSTASLLTSNKSRV